ncbi:MAG: YggS family pyridoxal phosphate-dependent enzyme [Deltaproteobacteria bacterium]|nr:YggS family pyridoxal phosphate-dependent enzyme [Deltaproteobacteria bacterium]NND30139.1 YggS family pyridoxal phosphate-dependent enzyme [Myxococcales bacterium]MBT8465023.1 YggS family pyridoxal phosphate-dependent enzyme [Deltaproteobacteria bacterium]MBT8480603.1 YggS family pyridoxal phosphate-dependent enzyme [Deltaproteobacteria bacterium]NNK08951.1 YggS family pyridoxal phosphate-dependent enzyme [Myxococcales bacterium]
MSHDVAAALDRVRERIALACQRSGREPGSVQLVAVSKGHSEELIRVAYDHGMRLFGENYAQELAQKAAALSDLPDIRWRFIGHLQRNKIKLVERARATVDTVDSSKLAEAISARAATRGATVEVLVQVNIGEERQKSGCKPDEVPALIDAARALPNVSLRGLMTVAPHFEDPEATRPIFADLRRLAEAHGLSELSMGMTHDLEQAVEEGSTMLRIGTAIFGPRPARQP